MQLTQQEVDRYDPASNTWTVMAPSPRTQAESHIGESTFVYDGRIIVVGGETGFNKPQRDIVDYDPVTNTWSELGLLLSNRSTSIAGVIADRRDGQQPDSDQDRLDRRILLSAGGASPESKDLARR